MDSHFGGIAECHSRSLDRIQGRRIVSEEKEPIDPTKAVKHPIAEFRRYALRTSSRTPVT